MNEKEKYSAEIEARLVKFGETLNEINTKTELRNESQPGKLQIDAALRKHREAQAKAKELEGSDSNTWEKVKTELDGLMNGIDRSLREALDYFG